LGKQISGWTTSSWNGLKKVFRVIMPRGAFCGINRLEALILKTLRKVRDLFIAVIFNPIALLLGGGRGKGGEAFHQVGEKQREVEPPLRRWKNLLRLPDLSVNLPYVLQEWQKKQASTVVYEKPVRLTIAPSL
jgi:hypothetical protein